MVDKNKQSGDTREAREPEEIEEEIEQTRQELGDTVAAVTDKADVKKQAKTKVAGAKQKAAAQDKDAAKQKANAAGKEQATAKVKEATPESGGAGLQQAQALARENPVPVAIGGALAARGPFALGWVMGRR